MINLVIHFRDFRTTDNCMIDQLHKMGINNIVPIFVFIDEQIDSRKNKYFSNNAVQFLCESLDDLKAQYHKKGKQLYIYHDNDIVQCISKIHKLIPVEGIYYNADFTPYAKKRSSKIIKWCAKNNIQTQEFQDYLLAPIRSFMKDNASFYTVYTPFKNKVYDKKHLIMTPKSQQSNLSNCIVDKRLESLKEFVSNMDHYYKRNNNILVKGGSKEVKRMLNSKRMKNINYETDRNTLSISTSHLSAYIKFGCISIRTLFWYFYHMDDKRALCDQLIWREFYYYINHYHPELLDKSQNFISKYDKIEWVKNKKWFDAWKTGTTGFPVVDAAMRELNTTGYMHNRGRLITANFLNRILGHDWRDGEKYFATQLTDYDPCVNNGNWQWIASTGTDPKPYFQRLFNPHLQSEKFDKEALYIKQWIPSLKQIPAKELHEWNKHYQKYDLAQISYVRPIVDYATERKRSIAQYTSL